MPLVYDRILDKVVFAHSYHWFASVLHPAQSLTSIIKEAQFNFCEAQALLLKQAQHTSSILLIDLSKALRGCNRTGFCIS